MSPKTLSESPEETVRQLLTDQWGTPSVDDGGYDPTQTDTTASDFLVITTDWSGWGDTWPIISLTNTDPTVPGGGDTQVTGIQGNGSGPNQRRLETMTMTVMASQTDTGDYQGESAEDIVRILYEHAFQIIWNNQHASDFPEINRFSVTPGAHTTNGPDSSQTEQYSGNVTVDWLKTP